MIPLPDAPERAFDARYRAVEGRFAGMLHEVRWGYYRGWLHGQVRRALIRKRWFQVVVRTPSTALLVRIQDDGTVGHGRVAVFDLQEPGLRFERVAPGAPLRTLVAGFMAGEGTDAFLRVPGAEVTLTRPVGGSAWQLRARWDALDADLTLDAAAAPTSTLTIGAAPAPWEHRPGLTQRAPQLAVRGRLSLDGADVDLAGATAEVTYANAFMAPATRARIASATGHLPDGRPVSLALSDGDLHGSCPEAALLLDGAAYALPRVRALRDGARWRLTDADGALDLRMTASFGHRAAHTTGPLRRLQTLRWDLGALEGTLPLPDGEAADVRLAAVCEDHRWA